MVETKISIFGFVSGSTEGVTATFDLFDSSSGPDLTLSPQTFTNSAEAFINDNSNSLGVPAENDAGKVVVSLRYFPSTEKPTKSRSNLRFIRMYVTKSLLHAVALCTRINNALCN